MCFTLGISMDVAFLILWWCWRTRNVDDFVGNLGISDEFFKMFPTGLVELLPISNCEPLTYSLTETGYFDTSQPKRIIRSGSSCKIKRTWASLIFFALKMWLTWYQVVDHVYYSQSNMAKGKCSIDDSLNTKVSPFFNTPFPSLY